MVNLWRDMVGSHSLNIMLVLLASSLGRRSKPEDLRGSASRADLRACPPNAPSTTHRKVDYDITDRNRLLASPYIGVTTVIFTHVFLGRTRVYSSTVAVSCQVSRARLCCLKL